LQDTVGIKPQNWPTKQEPILGAAEKPRHVTLANYVPFAVRMGVVDQEASLTAGLGKPPAYRNLVGLCELLQTLRFSFLFFSFLYYACS